MYRGPGGRLATQASEAPEVPARAPVSSEERMTVLRMVEQGTITAGEAAKLLASMEGQTQ